jgi:hypothetical protein
MPEFKFSCPKCSQNILCDMRHVGSQINCPSCRESIVVPPSSPPPIAPAGRAGKVKLSKLLNILAIGMGALLAVGIIALILYNLGRPMRSIRSEWSVISGDSGQWSLENGKIKAHSDTGDSIFASSGEYGNVTFSAVAGTPNREATLAIRMQDAANGYLIVFVPSNSPRDPAGFIRLVKRTSGDETTIAACQKQKLKLLGTRQSAKIKVVARDSLIEIFVNGVKVIQTNDSTFATGFIGFRIYGQADAPCDATFSKVTFH